MARAAGCEWKRSCVAQRDLTERVRHLAMAVDGRSTLTTGALDASSKVFGNKSARVGQPGLMRDFHQVRLGDAIGRATSRSCTADLDAALHTSAGAASSPSSS